MQIKDSELLVTLEIAYLIKFPLIMAFKKMKDMFSVFLISSYRNPCASLGELKKAVETLACSLC